MQQALNALTHVASQLLYRWLQPPAASAQGTHLTVATRALTDLTLHDWRDVLRDPRCLEALPWLKGAPPGLQLSTLATAAFVHFRDLQAAGGRYLSIGDQAYPQALRSLSDPPLGLSILGDPTLLSRPAVAVVGSRKASAHALAASFELGRRLAEAGALVVSGGALGCDMAAHCGVLATSGTPAPAACVFAGGLAKLYPLANAPAFRRLRARQALLISERLWGAPCRPLDFPVRNRIISGLCQTVVVMQAAKRSGALLTARLALDQGRDVAVLRHPPGDVRAKGNVGLGQDGAFEFGEVDELISSLQRGGGLRERPVAAASEPPGGHEPK